MNQRDVQAKIDVVRDNIEKLQALGSMSVDEFMSDFRNLDSALHRLQTSIQALLDMGGYIIASLGLKAPETNAEIVEILCANGHLPKDKMETYIRMSQFRNRIVHLYNHIDAKAVYDILTTELHDIKSFFTSLLSIIEKHPDGSTS